MHTLAAPTLAAALWPARGARTDIFRAAILAFAGSVFLAISAKFQIPFWPVPFTLQTFVVSILGMVYGRKLAVAAVLLYLGEGAVGLPVFAGGGGLAYFAGPTAGYLLAFLPAAFLLGWLAERGWGRGFVATFAAMTMGAALVFAVRRFVVGLPRLDSKKPSPSACCRLFRARQSKSSRRLCCCPLAGADSGARARGESESE